MSGSPIHPTVCGPGDGCRQAASPNAFAHWSAPHSRASLEPRACARALANAGVGLAAARRTGVFGQIYRLTGAATKTFIGLVPTGNTGGANVERFVPCPSHPRSPPSSKRQAAAGRTSYRSAQLTQFRIPCARRGARRLREISTQPGDDLGILQSQKRIHAVLFANAW